MWYIGSIPAWAGETAAAHTFNPVKEVYPRVGGGNRAQGALPHRPKGLSPRGRGKLSSLRIAFAGSGSIPAWAGETSAPLSRAHLQRVYPRVGGGNQLRGNLCMRYRGLSPRGRGKRLDPALPSAAGRSIPAWAGETCRMPITASAIAVYPRVGGGNLAAPYANLLARGLSPRGRGKPLSTSECKYGVGYIPAWAGET